MGIRCSFYRLEFEKNFTLNDDVCSETFIKPNAIVFDWNTLLTLYT